MHPIFGNEKLYKLGLFNLLMCCSNFFHINLPNQLKPFRILFYLKNK